jgi:hypothetical protein
MVYLNESAGFLAQVDFLTQKVFRSSAAQNSRLALSLGAQTASPSPVCR